MTTLTNRWVEESPFGDAARVVRHVFRIGTGWPEHNHDYAEVFWVERGSAEHVVNGELHLLRVGDCWCLRPQDCHAGTALGGDLAIVNVSFNPDKVEHIRLRFSKQWLWPAVGDACHWNVPIQRRERLFSWAEELGAGRNDTLDVEAFIVDLMRLARHPAGTGINHQLPVWLHDALAMVAEPRHLVGGCQALATLAGRSMTHVNRVLQQVTGRTATDLITELRLNRAAALLRLTDRSVAAIAADIGLENMGHFYHCFHRQFGTTPAHYRRQARTATS